MLRLFSLAIVFLHINFIALCQSNEYYFKRIGLKDGLSQSMINCIAQDSLGYMWFGTQDGLNRYDGYEFKVFKHIDNNSKSLLDNNINVIHKDKAGELWVGTRGAGLNKFNYATEDWESYVIDTLNNFNVLSIVEDFGGKYFWVGTNIGVFSFNKEKKQWRGPIASHRSSSIFVLNESFLLVGTDRGLKHISKLEDRGEPILDQYSKNVKLSNKLNIKAIVKGEEGLYWIGTKNSGLWLYQHKKKIDSVSIKDLENKEIHSMFYNSDSTKKELWIGTNRGILIYDISNQKTVWIKSNPDITNTLSNDLVLSIFKSKSGLLWIGTQLDINLHLKNRNPFQKAKKFSTYFVWSFYEDENNIKWIGTNKGLIKYPGQTNGEGNNSIQGYLTDKTIRSICKNKESNKLWIGTSNGLFLFDKNSGSYRKIPLKGNKYDFIRTLHEDSHGTLWIGTEEGGIITHNQDVSTFYESDSTHESIGNNRILSFYEDRNGEIWVGTYGGGLNKFNKYDDSTFTRYKYYIQGRDTIKTILACISIFPIDSNTFWVGTIGDGLLKFNKSKGCFTERYTIQDDLPNNTVYSILKDSTYLWVSTNNGLSRFNPEKKQFWNFDISDGLQNNEFNARAFLKSKNGHLYFGGINGFNIVIPDSLAEHQYWPKPIITSIKAQMNNRLQELLNKPEYHKNNEISLPYKNNSFELEFVTIHFPSPQKIKYKWCLSKKGSTDSISWEKASYANRKIQFYGLNPGEYEFQVKSTNCDGVWEGFEKITKLNIKIKKPLWLMWWFWGVLIIILGSFVYLYLVWARRNSIKLERRLKEELKKEQSKSTRLEYADKLIAWFAHETKTPLEIIYTGITTIQKLLAKIFVNANTNEFYRMQRINENSSIILENAQQTNQIIKQLRIISLKQLESDLRKVNLKDFLNNLYESMKYYREDKDIKLDLIGDYDETIRTYPIALRQIFFNLLLNSITHGFHERKKGDITISIKKRATRFEFEFEDNGKGISKENQKTIFIEFFSSIKGGGGTGLGMYIITTILERDFKGNIRLKESIPNKKTTFEFTIKRFDI